MIDRLAAAQLLGREICGRPLRARCARLGLLVVRRGIGRIDAMPKSNSLTLGLPSSPVTRKRFAGFTS